MSDAADTDMGVLVLDALPSSLGAPGDIGGPVPGLPAPQALSISPLSLIQF